MVLPDWALAHAAQVAASLAPPTAEEGARMRLIWAPPPPAERDRAA